LLAACAGGQAEATAAADGMGATQEPGGQAAVAETPTAEPTPIPSPTPTPVYDYLTVSSLAGAPQDTPEGTFELYLRDSIAQQAALQRQKVSMRAHYQDPEILKQDLGGLVVDIKLIEDRSKAVELSENSVLYNADIDIEVTFADQETRLQRCNFPVNLEKVGQLWYVVKPKELLVFEVCVSY